MKVVITDEAEQDLDQIAFGIAQVSLERALIFAQELRQSCLELSDYPFRFQLLERFATFGVRRRVHGKYLIFYRPVNGTVEVLRILHGAMDYEAVLFPEGSAPQ